MRNNPFYELKSGELEPPRKVEKPSKESLPKLNKFERLRRKKAYEKLLREKKGRKYDY